MSEETVHLHEPRAPVNPSPREKDECTASGTKVATCVTDKYFHVSDQICGHLFEEQTCKANDNTFDLHQDTLIDELYEYEQNKADIKVKNRLRDHIGYWGAIGANDFVLGVI